MQEQFTGRLMREQDDQISQLRAQISGLQVQLERMQPSLALAAAAAEMLATPADVQKLRSTENCVVLDEAPLGPAQEILVDVPKEPPEKLPASTKRAEETSLGGRAGVDSPLRSCDTGTTRPAAISEVVAPGTKPIEPALVEEKPPPSCALLVPFAPGTSDVAPSHHSTNSGGTVPTVGGAVPPKGSHKAPQKEPREKLPALTNRAEETSLGGQTGLDSPLRISDTGTTRPAAISKVVTFDCKPIEIAFLGENPPPSCALLVPLSAGASGVMPSRHSTHSGGAAPTVGETVSPKDPAFDGLCQPKLQWCATQAFELCDNDMAHVPEQTMFVDNQASVLSVVADLNTGMLECTTGFCVVNCLGANVYCAVYRNDMEDWVKMLFPAQDV